MTDPTERKQGKKATWTLGKADGIDVESPNAGCPLQHMREINAFRYKKLKAELAQDAEDVTDAVYEAGSKKDKALTGEEQIEEYREKAKARFDRSCPLGYPAETPEKKPEEQPEEKAKEQPAAPEPAGTNGNGGVRGAASQPMGSAVVVIDVKEGASREKPMGVGLEDNDVVGGDSQEDPVCVGLDDDEAAAVDGDAAPGSMPPPNSEAEAEQWPEGLRKLHEGLDAQQSKALELVVQGSNLLLVGSGGSGKTETFTRMWEGKQFAAVPVDMKVDGVVAAPTHTQRRVLTNAFGKKGFDATVVTVAKSFGAFPGETMKGASIAGKVIDNVPPGRRFAREASGMSVLMLDEAGQIDPTAMTELMDAFCRVRYQLHGKTDMPQVILGMDYMQNLPIKQYGTGRLLLESDLITQYDFKIIHLDGAYRNNDPRMQTVLKNLRVEYCDEGVIDFFQTAATVKLGCENYSVNEFNFPPEMRCRIYYSCIHVAEWGNRY